MTLFKPCITSVGPKDAKIAIVGEAPGESEETQGIPFVGYSGNLLNTILKKAEILRSECFLTNVLFTRPPANKIEAFCVKRTEPGAILTMPSLQKGHYLKTDFLPELERLYNELRAVRPNLIVALGNTASWAILKQTSISKIRGTLVDSPFGKVLPTYHPAAIFRQWDMFPVVLADMMKAKREMAFPEIRRPRREIIINPSFTDINSFYYDYCISAKFIAIDIETKNGQITCIGFAVARDLALVIPFVDNRKPNRSYWNSVQEECVAWEWVQAILLLSAPKIFQNGLYDMQYLRRRKMKLVNVAEDTMLMHHAMHPELLKGLGFMGSIYTDEPAWKLMRKRSDETLKADDE